jgi:hypothetical protein
MMERQLYASVKMGRRITFHVFDGDDISGYLAGMDSERFFVLEPYDGSFRHQFISRGAGTPVFQIHEAVAGLRLEDENCREEMETIIIPFRKWIVSNMSQRPEDESRPGRARNKQQRRIAS